ncbi:hypothetical protein Q765_11305 [Flavobacterium rivuli WB 3.3-2 = DSM 21788]|uniref:Lipoprotein n=1 Tax=Flavobacterium rivuli WB 3.3-2 = DSM 21788 TaxID=1121895 RepID=A0A0A2M4R8_9FLAO|nr:hypothetical protein Q765_11305 [Flavobacterium rivuli WB 3.3-2 = DSM 21788]
MKNIIVSLFVFSLVVSCTDCESLAYYYKNKECSLLISNNSGGIELFAGKNPFTGEECDCKDSFRWYGLYQNHMDIGDTLIKKKGELFFSVHKKDTVLKFDWGECEGKIYK